MLLASFTVVVSAEEAEADVPEYEFNTSKSEPAMLNYLTGEYERVDEEGKTVVDIVDTKEERLELMDLRLQKGDYRLYVDAYSGEVAVEKISTGEILFTNPYDVGANKSLNDDDKKAEMLSQLVISYVEMANDNKNTIYNTFKNGAKGGDLKNTAPSQINVKYIKDGIRVEYSVGRTDSRYLVPERITRDAFLNQIYNVAINAGCTSMEKMQLDSMFKLYDLNDPKVAKSETLKEQYLARFPMLQKTVGGEVVNVPIYVFTGVTKPEYKAIEKIIKKYCPDFTYEELDNQHLELDYSPQDRTEALFKVALEYTLDEKGLSVRLPANGIRFDESLFRLEYIQILPFMGAGMSHNSSYTFFPDGSGTLFNSDKLNEDFSFFGKIYGEDFGYADLGSGAPHNEIVRYPVFGISETEVDAETGKEKDRGFVAIIEEGETLTTLISYYTKGYNTVKMQVNPRPSDIIKTAGMTLEWTVVSERKYTGNFKIRYMMLSDEEDVAEKGGYTADYVGMAKAYRDYLVDKGVLTRLTDADVKKDIPLYIETFGAIETTKKFLSIPYQTNVALTSFENIKTMYTELSESGVNNVNFLLTGYTKGGLTKGTIPYGLKWDGAVEKGYKFEELLADADGKFGVYPDFDFAFVSNNELFDGLTLDKHAVKTIDGRYTSKREYSATRQTYINYYEMAISPAYFSRFYEKLTGDYLKTSPQGISVSTIGDYLASDFDEDEPYNREDTKEFTVEAFDYFDRMYNKVITSGGNAYSWKYVDTITDISTDSSRHSSSAATVPFLGMVLHGFVETVSTPINMEGNIDYAMLRAIENGVSFKFMLSYDNTEQLKEYKDTSVYYSIRYDIWLADLVERYDEINRALKDVQTSTIEKHQFIGGIRIPDNDEIYDDAIADLELLLEAEKTAAADEKESIRARIQEIRSTLRAYEKILDGDDLGYTVAKASFDSCFDKYVLAKNAVTDAETALAAKKSDMDAKAEALATAEADEAAKKTEAETAKAAYEEAQAIADAEGATEEQKAAAATAKTAYETAQAALDAATAACTTAKTDSEAAVAAHTEAQTALDTAKATCDGLVEKTKLAYAEYTAKLTEIIGYYENAASVREEILADFHLLEENGAYTPEMIAELENILDRIDENKLNFILGKDLLENELNVCTETVTKDYPELLTEAPAEDDGEETDAPIVESTEKAYNKYEADETSVVYEEYSNGKAFVLNFNNFTVKVQINGMSYTVAPYGYIVVK